eukprot:1801540-Rhodomonas_salina.6
MLAKVYSISSPVLSLHPHCACITLALHLPYALFPVSIHHIPSTISPSLAALLVSLPTFHSLFPPHPAGTERGWGCGAAVGGRGAAA